MFSSTDSHAKWSEPTTHRKITTSSSGVPGYPVPVERRARGHTRADATPEQHAGCGSRGYLVKGEASSLSTCRTRSHTAERGLGGSALSVSITLLCFPPLRQPRPGIVLDTRGRDSPSTGTGSIPLLRRATHRRGSVQRRDGLFVFVGVLRCRDPASSIRPPSFPALARRRHASIFPCETGRYALRTHAVLHSLFLPSLLLLHLSILPHRNYYIPTASRMGYIQRSRPPPAFRPRKPPYTSAAAVSGISTSSQVTGQRAPRRFTCLQGRSTCQGIHKCGKIQSRQLSSNCS